MNYAGETNLLEEADGGSKAEGETAACREPKFADGIKLGLSADSSGKEREVENSTRADGERSVSSYIKGGSFEHQAGVLLKEGEESGLPEKGIVQRDASADRRNLPWMQHQEIKQTSPIEDQKRIKDIRAFWEKEQTSPRSGNQEDLLTKNTSINKGTHGYKSESRKIKPAGESLGYVRGESDSEEGKYNLVTFRRVELSDDSEPNDSNVNLSLRRIKPELTDKSQGGSPVTRSSKTLPSNWKGAGFTESSEAGNLKTGNDAMLSPKKGRDIQTVALAKDKMSSTLQQKPNFTVHSLKEKVNEESKSEMLNPSQFQSLRSFWGAGVKPQGRIEEAKETRIPHSNSGGTSQQPSMEVKGVRDEAGQICLEEEEQKSETNEGFLKATPNQPLLANEASRKSLRFVPQENSYLVELAVSEPLEKMTPPGKEVEESVERTVVPSKMQPILFNRDLQKLLIQTSQESLPAGLLSDERGAPKETEGQTHTDHAIQHRTVSTDVSSNVGHTTSEIAETVHRTVIPPNVDVDSFNAGIERLVKEALDARPSSDGSGAVNTSKQSAPPSEERSFYNKVMQLSRNAHPTDQAKRDVVPQSLEKRVSTSDQNVRFKTEGDAPAETRGINSALRTAPNHKEFQVYQDDVSSQKKDLRIPSPTLILPDARLAALNRAETPGKEVSDMVTESRVPLKRENHDLNSQLLILLKETSEFPSVSCMTESVSKAAAGGLPGEGQEASYQQVMATSALPSPATVSLSRETSREKTEKRDDGFGRMGEDPNGETAMVFPFVNQKNVRGQSHDQGRGDVTSVGKLVELQLKEVAETVVKTVKPNALEPTRFKDSLNNLMKEDSQVFVRDIEFPKPVFVSLCPSNGEKDMPPFQEIHESVEKATVPSNSVYGEFQTNFRKLLMEDTTFLPSNQDGRKMERTANDKSEPNQMSGLVGRQEVGLQEVEETVHKTVVPAKRQQNELNSGLQKLLAEFSHMSPAQIQELGEKLKAKLQTGQGVEETGDLSQDSVEKSVAPSEETVFDSYSGKLTKEDSGASLQLSKDRNLEAPYDSTSRSEDRNVLVTMPALIRRSSSDYRSELKIPLKGKASKPDVQVPADGKISVVPVGNLFSQKIEQVNLLSAEAPLPGKEESSPTVAKADETETGYDTQRDTGVVSSANVTLDGGTEEMDVLLGPRRTSTPRAEQETPPRLSQVELILAVRHRKNEEYEGARSFGSDLSNESIDYSLAESKRNSTCSAEDPNPVLEALKRSSNRQIPSKSLEDIPSATSNEGKVNTRKEDLMLSAEDDQKAIQRHEPHTTTPGISAAPSFPVNQFSNPEKVKRMSKSVPTFLQEESDGRETDTASENSYSLGKIKKSPSSLTNLSGSSGLASLSSVSTSVVSVYSGDFGNVDVKGNIQFAIDYVEQLKELHIFIAQCKDLAVADVKKQRSDPYVKCYLLPEKYKLGKRKTSVKKKTLNPVYNEILRYKVDKILLTSQRLNISVWHNDTFGRNSFLGEVDLDLGSWDWDDRQIKQMIWYPLKPRAPLASLELENRGEIKLSLQYIPQPDGGKKPSATGEVHIWVKECHDLPLLKGNKLNTFVKCTVLPDTSRKSRQKTRAVAKATNPVFNHTMVYDGFKFEDLKEACVELTVWDHKQLVNHFLGGLRIGLGTGKSYGTAVDWMDSTLEETSLWERMMNSPDQWVEGTLPLRMLTIAKMTK
ncbi:synaptotagmin-like protein 2 isoform X1 [Sphaerodactylus townsendi]|uniref:synaptotagmin-like protein 2 isoform X1 n=1 Tax=Sphaerodactylus townsendi TaxID=933632 RepID=UPI0020263833|nr:synaptotagmin-like protein 2 isoform X1 [Sphaerodactylus townsendi]